MRITAVSGAGIAAVALTLTLAACGSDTKTGGEGDLHDVRRVGDIRTPHPRPSPRPRRPHRRAPAAAGETLDDYIAKNGIQKTVIRRGEPN